MMVNITLPDGTIKEVVKGTTALDVAMSISEGLARNVLAAEVNGDVIDSTRPINSDSTLKLLTWKDDGGKSTMWHSSAHLLAEALEFYFPGIKLAIGPPIKHGFYYDVDCDEINDETLPKLEAEMQKIIKENLKISLSYKTKEEALKFFKNNKYKTEIIEAVSKGDLNEEELEEGNLENGKFKFYKQGEFEDLCTGPHLPSTGLIKAFKLEKVTKAYWRADSNNKQLNRVYGTAFWKKTEMDEYFEMLEEAKKRDHRVLGKHLDLFMSHEYAPGMTFFLPKGFHIWKNLQNFIRDQYKKYDYKEVMTPNMFNKKLWETSGHWEHYKDDMFIFNVEGQEFSLKPMNCPSHCLIFKNDFKSYKELPLRIADFGALHRNELSGTLSGLTRVRKFCQDDAHIFCTMEQVEDEIDKLLEFVDYVYKDVFQMEYEIELSTRPDDFLGTKKIWDSAEKALANAIERNKKEYKVCEGDGAFYGPKIDFRIRDTLNRIWQTATIQLDFNLPERFELKYESKNQGLEQPVMIHRAILGSLERFMAVMIEHFAGKFPLWISPNQISIINVADRHIDYCNKIKEQLEKENFIVKTHYENEGVGKKIALARENEKPNYTLVLGDKDIENKTISVRTRKVINGKNEEFTIDINKFIKDLIKERDSKEIKN
jgi:threonyl-tRNA synthetase